MAAGFRPDTGKSGRTVDVAVERLESIFVNARMLA